MIELSGQELKKGDFVANIDVWNGSCSAGLCLIVGFTPKKVRILSRYRLRDYIQDNITPTNGGIRVPTRLIKLTDETVRNIMRESDWAGGEEDFEKLIELAEQFRE